MKTSFDHVHHFKDFGYFNGDGNFVPTRMTVVSHLNDDNTVEYKVGFCSRNEKNFCKKDGREAAYRSEHVFKTEPVEEATHNHILDSIIDDLFYNRQDKMPNAHRRFAQLATQMWSQIYHR